MDSVASGYARTDHSSTPFRFQLYSDTDLLQSFVAVLLRWLPRARVRTFSENPGTFILLLPRCLTSSCARCRATLCLLHVRGLGYRLDEGRWK